MSAEDEVMTAGGRVVALTELEKNPAWKLVVERHKRELKAIEASVFSDKADDATATRLRHVRIEAAKIGPEAIRQQLLARAKVEAQKEAEEVRKLNGGDPSQA